MKSFRYYSISLFGIALIFVSGVVQAQSYTFLTKWGTFGTADGQFDEPTGIAVDGSGDVYVADGDNHRIQEFSRAPPPESGCVYESLFIQEWFLIAADLGLIKDVPETPGRTVPERWGIAMVRTVLCNTEHPHHDATLLVHTGNVLALESKSAEVLARVAPYKNVLAALLLINQSRQDHFKTLLGLTGTYETVRGSGRAVSDEIFSAEGDLDGDGANNIEEFDNVVSSGGSIDDFAESTSDPTTKGIIGLPASGWFGLIFLVLGLTLHFQLRRKWER